MPFHYPQKQTDETHTLGRRSDRDTTLDSYGSMGSSIGRVVAMNLLAPSSFFTLPSTSNTVCEPFLFYHYNRAGKFGFIKVTLRLNDKLSDANAEETPRVP